MSDFLTTDPTAPAPAPTPDPTPTVVADAGPQTPTEPAAPAPASPEPAAEAAPVPDPAPTEPVAEAPAPAAVAPEPVAEAPGPVAAAADSRSESATRDDPAPPRDEPAAPADPPTGFAALGLDPRLVTALTAAGYADPTPIQAQAIPPVLAGKDLIGLAATGTGKTAAFSLPILHRLAADPGRGKPSVLILVPTRELCLQVAAAVSKYGRPLKIGSLPVYGGAGFGDQVRGLRSGIDVVVATPGRALDHLRRGTLDLGHVRAAVLDEADEMLDMGFAEDIEAILSATPAGRQTLLFSATMPPRIAAIAQAHLKDPVRVTIARPVVAAGEAPKVRETVYVVPREFKTAALARVLDFEAPTSALVFCRTRTEADGIADALLARGHRPESLHGGLSQEQRDRVMKKFRAGAVNLLVATDVAARGLDISHLSHVVNFGVPQAAETYVHRIGRTGRAGREGVAITVADPREQGMVRTVERVTGRKIGWARLPSAADLRARRLERTRDAVRDLAKAGGLAEFEAAVGPLAAELGPAQVALAAFALAHKAAGAPDAEPEIPSLQPAPPRDRRADNMSRPGFGPRPGRGEFGPRPDAGPRPGGVRPKPGKARVYIGAGRGDRVGRRDLIAAFEAEVGIGPRDLGDIVVADRHSVVEVPAEIADHVIDTLQGVRFAGRPVVVRADRDRPPAPAPVVPPPRRDGEGRPFPRMLRPGRPGGTAPGR